MNWLGAKKRKNDVIGVEFSAEGIAFAHITRTPTQQPLLVNSEFIPVDASSNPPELLRGRLTKLGLAGVDCNIVLSAGSYQLLLGEAPKVPLEELAEALKWRVKDLIQFPINDAIIDAILLPEDSARGTSRMAYAVVTQRNTIQQVLAQAKVAHLNVQTIDIPELSLRNLVQACCDSKRGVALVKLAQGGGTLQIIRDGNMYLSRQFSLPYNAGLLDDIPADSLVLELQRSLDYFERQMRQTPPSNVYLCGENVSADKLTPDIRNSLAVKIDLLSIESGVQLGSGVQEHSLALCMPAIGAALREDEVGAA